MGKPHGIPDADDEGAGEQVKEGPDVVVRLLESESATGFDEEVVARKKAESGGDEGGSVAHVPDSGSGGPGQRDDGEVVAHPRVEKPTQQNRRSRRAKRDKRAER